MCMALFNGHRTAGDFLEDVVDLALLRSVGVELPERSLIERGAHLGGAIVAVEELVWAA